MFLGEMRPRDMPEDWRMGSSTTEKVIYSGLERWPREVKSTCSYRGPEYQVPTWGLITACNSSSRGSNTFLTATGKWRQNIHIHKVGNFFKVIYQYLGGRSRRPTWSKEWNPVSKKKQRWHKLCADMKSANFWVCLSVLLLSSCFVELLCQRGKEENVLFREMLPQQKSHQHKLF